MNQILLVEGNDEFHVFQAIFEKYNVDQTFDIKDAKGIDNLLIDLPTYLRTDLKSIGIVLDANSDITKRWTSLKKILNGVGYDIPKTPIATGTIVRNDELPIIGIWLMPNNEQNGMLEDFVRHLIPENDNLIPFVDETLDSLEEAELNKYKSIHKSKARIHTWLAWQEDPGTPMGLAITKTYLDTNQEFCNQFIEWINELFNRIEP